MLWVELTMLFQTEHNIEHSENWKGLIRKGLKSETGGKRPRLGYKK